MKTKQTQILWVATAVATLGLVILLVVCFSCNFRLGQLFSGKEATYCEQTFSPKECAALVVTLNTMDCEIAASTDEDIHVQYYNTEWLEHSIAQTGDCLKIDGQEKREHWWDYLRITSATQTNCDRILLPADFYGDLTVTTATGDITVHSVSDLDACQLTTTTGKITLSDFMATSACCNCTTGMISANQVQFEKDVLLHTTTGHVTVQDVSVKGNLSSESTTGNLICSDLSCASVQASSTTGHQDCTNLYADFMSLHTSTGRITLSGVDAKAMKIATTTGDVCGTLCGTEEWYSISFDAQDGIQSTFREQGRPLSVSSTTGNIDLTFLGE